MSKLIDGIILRQPSSGESQEPVSLAELLLQAPQEESQPAVKEQQTELATKSRKGRRKRLKSSGAVNKRKSQMTSQKSSSREVQNKKRQQRNFQALQVNKKQKNQSGNISETSDYVGKARGSTKKTQLTKELSSSQVFRPVVLATIDYDPTQKSLLTLLKMKRDVRRIKVDKMQAVTVDDSLLEDFAVATAMQEYSIAKKQFFSSLDPAAMSQYAEALTALGLSVSEDVSATEILYSLAFAYSSALSSGSRRIDESPDVAIETGPSIQVSRGNQTVDGYRLLLRSRASAYDNLKVYDSTDSEVSIKCLTSLLAKELLFSYNLQKEEISNLNDMIPKMYQTVTDTSVLISPKFCNPITNSGRRTAHGVCFKDMSGGKPVLNYPFEPSKIQSTRGKTKAVLEYIDNLTLQKSTSKYRGITTKGDPSTVEDFDTPYARASSGYQACADLVETVFDITSFDGLSEGGSAYLKLFNSILEWVSQYASVSNSSSNVLRLGVQLHAMAEASQSHDMLDALIVYLAFRQEKLEGYTGEGSTLTPGPSSILRSSSRLKSLIGGMDTGKRQTSTTVDPREVTISPPLSEDASGDSESFTSPEQATTIETLESIEGSTAASLESLFGKSYNEICEWFAEKLVGAFNTNSTSAMSVGSTKTAGSLESVTSTLMENELAVLDNLLSYNENLSTLFGTDPEYSSFYETDESTPRSLTYFSRFTKPMIFAAYTLLTCRICDVILSNKASMLVNTVTESSSSRRKKSSSKGREKSSSSSSASTSTREGSLVVSKFSVNFSTDMQNIQAYLDGDPDDTSQIVDSYPVLSSVISALAEEERFLSSFASSLSDFYDNVDTSYEALRSALTLPALSDGTTLGSVVREGLSPSRDMAKLFKSFPWYFNTEDMEYNGKKLRDKVTSDAGFSLIENSLLKSDAHVMRKKQKILCIGIPAGMLESVSFEPSSFEEITSPTAASGGNKYSIVVQKIDQVNSDAVYGDLTFTFSRDIFCLESNESSSAPVAFLDVADDFTCTQLTYSEALENYTDELVANHTNDFALKQFLDLSSGIDLSEIAFPAYEKEKKKSLSNVISIPLIANLDTTSEPFLSASNIAFDSKSRALTDFKFWDPENNTLSMTNQFTSDPYSYSTFEYLNSYGSLFSANEVTEKSERGLVFERVVCIPIDDDMFEIDYSEMSKKDAAALKSALESQKKVGVGVETSEGIDMFTYKVLLRTYDEGEEVS